MPQLSILIKPASSLCNLRCSYCFYAEEAEQRTVGSYGLMSAATLENLIRKSFAYAEGAVSFAFQGGEPTLAGKAFFRNYLTLLKKYNTRNLRVNSAIQTNGYLIDGEWCEIFREGGFLVGVSLDGTETLHDAVRRTADGKPTFRKIQENIQLLEREHIEYNILTVITEKAAKQPDALFDALKGYRYLQFIPCLDSMDAGSAFPVSGKSYGKFLIAVFRKYEKAFYDGQPVSIRNFDNWVGMVAGYSPENCAMSGRCGNYYLIEGDGTVFPCDFYALDRWRMGNINHDSFFRLEKSQTGIEFIQESLVLPENCRHCGWLTLCRGGCKKDREPILNGIPSENRLCEGHAMFFDACYDSMVRLAKHLQSGKQNGKQNGAGIK